MRIISSIIALLIIISCNNSSKSKKDLTAGEAGKKYSVQKNVQVPDQPTVPDTIFTGFGTEPFWSLYVVKGSKIIFHPADGPDVEVPFVEATTVNNATRYKSSSADASVELSIVKKECSDGMSDEEHAYRVILVVNKEEYTGCGKERK